MNASDKDAQARTVALVASGDHDALAALYDRYARPLYAYGLRRLGDEMRAEELTQVVMERVWRYADRYDPHRGSVMTWLMTIARNAAIDQQRRRGDAQLTPLPEDTSSTTLPMHGSPPDDGLEQLVRSQVVRSALEELSEEHRQVLELAYYKEYSQREVAELLDLPLGTVKSRTYHALRSVRTALHKLGAMP